MDNQRGDSLATGLGMNNSPTAQKADKINELADKFFRVKQNRAADQDYFFNKAFE